MPKSKHRKNHKQKAQARNNKILNEKAREKKMQREFIMDLIKKEQEKGLFNNTPAINAVSPITDGPTIDGPSI
jgi:NADH:ubiquinone oxidoreductase subunit E